MGVHSVGFKHMVTREPECPAERLSALGRDDYPAKLGAIVPRGCKCGMRGFMVFEKKKREREREKRKEKKRAIFFFLQNSSHVCL
jgi:hypothetical protein